MKLMITQLIKRLFEWGHFSEMSYTPRAYGPRIALATLLLLSLSAKTTTWSEMTITNAI